MVSQVLSFDEELNEVRTYLQAEIRFKAGSFDELIHYYPDSLDKNACPAIVLAVGRACGVHGKPMIRLASIIQYIFMADQIHRLMADDLDLAEDKRQFPVLVGDFLYGKFFLGLCREHILGFLRPLAEVIATMSQGGISRWLAQGREIGREEWIRILEQERAALTGLAARLSAELAGAAQHIQDVAEKLGWELGLAWAACGQGLERPMVEAYLAKARHMAQEFPQLLEVSPLLELIDYMSAELCPKEP